MNQDAFVVDRFELRQELGRGGFGVVWRAVDRSSGRTVALKLLHSPDHMSERRFVAEATALAALHHPHCVTHVAHGRTAAGQLYLATELIDGQSLAAWLASEPPVRDKRTIAAQIANALNAAHRAGIVHRDLKPANVLVRETRPPSAVVIDFGISKLLQQEGPAITATGEVIGTPGFMSPEQLRGTAVGHATDVYALGALLFEIFERVPPFTGSSAIEVAYSHLRDPVPALQHVPPDLQSLVVEMLAKEPERRPSMAQVERVLSGHGQVPSDHAPSGQSHEPMATRPEPREETPRFLVVSALLVFAVAALVVVLIARPEPEVSPPPAPPTRALPPSIASPQNGSALSEPVRPAILRPHEKLSGALVVMSRDTETAERHADEIKDMAGKLGLAVVTPQTQTPNNIAEGTRTLLASLGLEPESSWGLLWEGDAKQVNGVCDQFAALLAVDVNPNDACGEKTPTFVFRTANQRTNKSNTSFGDLPCTRRSKRTIECESEKLTGLLATFARHLTETGTSRVSVPWYDDGVAVYVPPTAPPLKRPVVLVFGDLANRSEQIMEDPALLDLSEQYGYVLAVFEDTSFRVWNRDDRRRIEPLIEALIKERSIDPEQIFGLAFGPAGRALEHLCWDTEHLRVIATIGYDRAATKDVCPRKTPRLSVFATQSPGTSIFGTEWLAAQPQIDHLKKAAGCKGPGRDFSMADDIECTEWTCDATQVTCLASHQRYFQGLESVSSLNTMPATHHEVWSFFEQHRLDPSPTP